MDSLIEKEKLSGILMTHGRAKNVAAVYLVYRTIEANDNITLNKLKRLLICDLLLKDETVEGAVASLSSKSIFNAVHTWIKPHADVIHLRVTRTPAPEFVLWLRAALESYPELGVYIPPVLA